ncbi:MAG TPA: hypothetical protein VNA17_07955 [Pyrinomonadaceae bacterium]|nr:hypothetical protein [Pyrinomonadaceae bacterium]
MLGKTLIHKSVTLVTVIAVWCVYSMAAFAVAKDVSGEITVTGQVTVNGQPAVSGSTILSGAVVTTAKGSSAVVSLGKLGRMEILEDSSSTLRFSDTGIVAVVDQGRVRVSSNSGIATTVTTKNATIIGDSGQANNFLVEAECSHTHVDTTSGLVTMREGSTDKQVVAGTTATAGNLSQAGCVPCLRPDSAPPTAIAGNTWLILLALGAAAAAIYLGTRSGDTNVDGTTAIVSPTR